MKSFRLLLALALPCLLLTTTTNAQVAGSLDPVFDPNVDGTHVLATAVQPDGKIVIGGRFFYVGDKPRTNIARLNTNGTVEDIGTFNPGPGAVGGDVTCLAVQPDGKILIGGDFDAVDGQERRSIARLNGDGSVESAFNPGTDFGGRVLSMAVQADGKILVGGSFNTVGGETRNNIARLNPDGTVESTASFNPGIGTNNGVSNIAIQTDGKIVIAGSFTHVDNHTRNYIARLTAGGTVEDTTTFNTGLGVDFPVRRVLVQADRKILLVGAFDTVNNQPRVAIARLNPNGTLESTATFNPTGIFPASDDPFIPQREVHSVALQANGKILVSAMYRSIFAPAATHYIRRISANGSVESSVTFNPGTGASDIIRSVALQENGGIMLGGNFLFLDGSPRNHIARLKNTAASQNLTVGATRVRWTRGGTAPEVEQTSFELSTNDGLAWTPLGAGVRIAGGWECAGLNLPVRGLIRARGRVNGGSLVERIEPFGPALLSLTAPTAGQRVTGGEVVFGGLVTDNTRVARIELALNGGAAHMATLDPVTGIWTFSTLPENGVNTVVVTAFDSNGVISAQITRTFTFAYLRPELAGSYNGILAVTGDSPTPIDHGGLISITVQATGSFTGKVTLSGTTFPISGIFLNDGSARFGKETTESLELLKRGRPGNISLGRLALKLDTAPDADRITGSLTQGLLTLALTQADRALYTSKKNPIAPFKNVPATLSDSLGNKGKYTALFRAVAAPNNGVAADGFPQGHGWAKMSIAATGKVTVIGRLADGSTVSYGNALSKTNELPFFIPLYAKKGFAAGRIAFDPSQAQTDAADAAMNWFKPANARDRLYTDGWPDGIGLDFAASKFMPPTKATPANPSPQYVQGTHSVLGLVGAPQPAAVTLEVTAGDTTGFSNDATVDARNGVVIGAASVGATAAPKLKVTLAAGTGALTGSFTHPGNNKATAFNGVVFQKTNSAGGYFLYFPPKPPGHTAPSGRSGGVTIMPKP